MHFSKLLLMALFIAGSSVRAMDVPPLDSSTSSSKTLDEQLLDAVGACDSVLAKKLLDDGAGVNSANQAGDTPLHVIAGKPHGTLGCEDIVTLLLLGDANSEARNNTQVTPLHVAAMSGNRAVALLLLGKGASVNALADNNMTPLHCAACFGRSAMVQLLLDKGATVDARINVGSTPLHWAAERGFAFIVHLLLRKGAKIGVQGYQNRTALHCAVLSGNAIVTQLVLDNGAIVDAQTTRGITPLMMACQKNHRFVIEVLLSYGAEISLGLVGNACLLKAQDNRLKLSQAKDFKTVAKLLSQGAFAYPVIKVFVVDPKRQELFAAIDRDDDSVVARLLKEGFTLNTCDKEGNTVLHKAIKANRTKVFDLLLSLGAHVYLGKPNALGVTPMKLLANGWLNAIETLIKCGYNDQAQAVSGKRKEAGQ